MNSALSGIPIPRRRQFAATLGLFAVLFVAVGAVAATGSTPSVVRVFSVVALIVAALLGLMAWGVLHSTKIDLAESRLDDAIEEAMVAHGGAGLTCGCGHDHDPGEMHVTDGGTPVAEVSGACAHDSGGAACAHDCDTCVLAAMRPSPNKSRAERLSS